MKDSFSTAIIVAIIIVVAARLYQRYFKKDKIQPGAGSKTSSSFPSSKEDDYEPYSKK